MNLLPQISSSSALVRKFSKSLLRLEPGLGDKAVQLAESIADSGLPIAAANMLIQAVYSPTRANGRGQSTRARWFVQSVQNRYSGRLEKIRNNLGNFRVFLAEMEDVNLLRDTLVGEDLNISFEAAMMVNECGLDAERFCSLVDDTCGSRGVTAGRAKQMVLAAVQCVQRGHFMTVDAALDSIAYGYQRDQHVD